ncbi:hypothetical protein QSH57_003237 [Fusarium oxysporum f. sp. vasinfectum]|nr:hypothetical protein QSH57_003237 [Fusarium oxysporum f. sp. vasinfectum]
MPFLISIRAPFHAGPSHNTMAYVGLQETWSRRNIPCIERMLFLHNLCLESRAARCCRCQYPETYSRYIEIIRGSELACIAVNLIHAIKAFQASKDEDKNVSPLLANLQDQQTHAREA